MKPAVIILALLVLGLAGYWLYDFITTGAPSLPLAIGTMTTGVATVIVATRKGGRRGQS